MIAFIADWLNLLFRWAHLVVAIGWIGTSFYFISLDLALRRRDGMRPGVLGTAWEVHSGGFYHVEKYTTAPDELPRDLIWFKWEAYLTFLTGMALMVVQFYWNAEAWMIDPAKLALAPWQAIALSLASLLVGWLAYDGLCRSPVGRHPVLLAGIVFVGLLAAAYGYLTVFSGRSAMLHLGALIGTIMAVNVFALIVPGQNRITAALQAGRAPDPSLGALAKQRSVHNTYLTLPVLVFMVSGHYPMLIGHPQAWLLAGLVIIGGAAARHLILRHEVGDPLGKIGWTLPVIAAALFAALWLTAPAERQASGAAPASDAQVLAIVQQHCAVCHAPAPSHEAFAEPPAGMVIQTLDDVRRYGDLIDRFAVQTEIMPLGNETGMTQAERDMLGAWIAAHGS
jgi:uncharacterized membrane protein